MTKTKNKHEEEYLHISKREFNGFLLIILGIGLLVSTYIIAIPGYDLPANLDWRLAVSNAVAGTVGFISGAVSLVYGISKMSD